jgi:transcriptional regulator with PAS, ATPase and Fis domain
MNNSLTFLDYNYNLLIMTEYIFILLTGSLFFFSAIRYFLSQKADKIRTMKSKILFIAPYSEMYQQACDIVSEFNFPVSILEGELYKGVDIAKKSENSGVEVIICRGGTAKLIAESVNIPVVEIEVSSFDLLRILLKHIKNKIAVIGSENVIYKVKSLCEILNLDIEYFSFVFEYEIKQKIETAVSNGAGIIIGDAVAARIAAEKGLKCELVISGREAILSAIKDALQINNAIVHEREKNLLLNAVVEHLNEGIVITDSTFKIKTFSPFAEHIFKISRENALEKKITEIGKHLGFTLPKLSNSVQIVSIDSKHYSASIIEIILDGEIKGFVYRFQDTTNIQELEEKIRKSLAKDMLVARTRFNHIVGNSTAISNTIRIAKKYASVDTTVLIYGESGTGKEMFAQSIHNASERKSGPFVAINCATIPSDLLESKLFGYEEGAFTGASKGGKRGVFELAHNGTLFLDEIGEMDLMTQARMLRVLQEKLVMRIGGEKNVPVNVRIIAASNKNLNEEVAKNRFRVDLFYRINVLKIYIPALHERENDVILLADHFLQHYCAIFKKPHIRLSDKITEGFKKYDWPGNVRHLENVIQKIVLLSEGKELSFGLVNDILSELNISNDSIGPDDFFHGTLEDINRKIIKKVLEQEGQNKSKTAKRLNITRATLLSKIT